MQKYPILDKINTPEDVKRLDAAALPELCAEVREFLIEHVSKTGGHLASNLGVVEITVGAHRVFSAPQDCIMFDVGHQCYVHKMLTGRQERFDTLRRFEGMSGFLRPAESPYDCFVSGHASNSISAALGMARAKRLLQEEGRVVCVIGDGALTGGMAYEALNDAGQSGEPLIIIFNDNEMSIGKSVGALADRLSRIRLKPRYFKLKAKTKTLLQRCPQGQHVISGISAIKNRLKSTVLKETLFELMGFRYLGPADGNDIQNVCTLLQEAKNLNEPVVIHLKTVKGKGYLRSEQNPDEYHGVSAFDVVAGQVKSKDQRSFSTVFGDQLCAFAENDPHLCAITAAMADGTGLSEFGKRFPQRFFDVGIAEEHAVTMASGMASRGARPVCALYSTFLQRGYDQLLHDVAIAGNHVVFAIDRAGLVGADGQTHQGVFDVPFLLTVPGMTLYAPASYAELESALQQAVYHTAGPVAVRYPRGGEGRYTDNTFDRPFAVLRHGSDVTLISYGIMINQALSAAEKLANHGISARVIKLNCLSNFDLSTVLASINETGRAVILEDSIQAGALGEKIAAAAAQQGCRAHIKLLNLKNRFIPEGTVDQLYSAYEIDSDAVVRCVLEQKDGR